MNATMMRFLSAVLWIFAQCVYASPADSVKKIHDMVATLHARGEFNGSILVAVRGDIIYGNGFGKANFQTGEQFTVNTASCIASVTKQFTALGIMMLAEQNKLSYDDPVSKHIQKLPLCYDRVTVRHLLTHTSGVSDYSNLGRGRPDKLIQRKESLRFIPGQKYEYSNSNYVLLSLIIESLSGMSFADFLQERIFEPLGMIHTFAYVRSAQKKEGVAIGYNQFGKEDDYNAEGIFGDGGIYSSVRDLYIWDQALYTDKLVKQSTLSNAFAPGTVSEGKSIYGFGWNISEGDGGKYVWHTGNTAGFRAYIQRRLNDQITIIILTNTGHSRRMEIAQAIVDILSSRPYNLPKMSVAKKMYAIIMKKGIQSAMQFYDSVRVHDDAGGYDLAESEFNLMGYELLNNNRVSDAIQIFRLNTIRHPGSSNTFDSLGEAYLKSGDKDSARINYQKALELDPGNENAASMLRKLK